MGAVSVSAKLTRREVELLGKLAKEYGFISKSEEIRSAVWLCLTLAELGPMERLRMFQLVNGMVAPSARTSSELVEEAHREEDQL